jgi:nucleotide-binding universal stress UspA family protein
MYKRILLPTDGSALAQRAAEYGLKLAKSVGASVVTVYASPPFEVPLGFEYVPASMLPIDVYDRATKAAADNYLGKIQAAATKWGVACKPRHLRSLTPAEAIVGIAETDKCDLIVIGSHGRGSFSSLLLGSVTQRVLALCNTPVLVHREPLAKAKRKPAAA